MASKSVKIRDTANRGEWSEFYALLYLLGSRKLVLADINLQSTERDLPVLKIMRHDKDCDPVDFVIKENKAIDVYTNNVFKKTFQSDFFLEKAKDLLIDIQNGSKTGAFTIPAAIELLSDLYLKKISAPSSQVADMLIQIHDILTGKAHDVGYSIKSYIGNAPTLLNASEATNFVYKVTGLSDEAMDEINSIETKSKILDRIKRIEELGGNIEFTYTDRKSFSDNLIMLDTSMEQIISYILLLSYSKGISDCEELLDIIEEENPLNFPRKGLYQYKYKKLLSAKALGMNPSETWDGYDSVNGGYIVVKSDGTVLAYHLYDRDILEQYLFQSTKLERASTSRHHYGSIYKENGEMRVKLNLQIRFYTPEQMLKKATKRSGEVNA